MIANPNLELRNIIRNYLRLEGYENFTITENGKSAWVKIREAPVDLVVADYELPDMSGLELLAAIRKDKRLKETLFLLISSEVHQDYIARAAELHVDAYLLKPFSHQILANKVNTIFRSRFRPDPGYLTSKEADRLLESGDVEGALLKYKEVIEATKSFMALMHYKIGGAHEKLKQIEEAESSYHEALRVSELHVDSLDALGSLNMKKGKHEDAAGYFKKSADISPLNAQRQFKLGEALLETNEPQEAEKAFKRSLAIDPYQTHIFNRLGISLRRQGKLDESLRFFEQALAATDDDEHLYFNTGQVYSQMGNREAARPLLIKALELNPDFTEAAELLEKIDRS